MASAPGLVPHNIRLPGPEQDALAANDIDIEVINDDGEDTPDLDPSGNVLKIEHGDGSVTISLDGSSLNEAQNENDPLDWFANLVDKIDAMELGRIADDLLRGIQDDIQSRNEWIEDRKTGIKLLGLKIEVPGLAGAADGAPVEGMSKVRDPLLLEAVLRFQANARSELLPTDGPVKIRDDTNGPQPPALVGSTIDTNQLADALETDLNHYLTAVATEYYPDTDRMLLMLGFGGTAFKKVYFCPLRSRPVSETVDADDLIVNSAATDLGNARRITHRIMMRPSTVKRMQILGAYRDIDLSTPQSPQLDSLQQEKASQQGVSTDVSNPEDRDREIYECYCELDIKGFEHKHKGKDSGLEIPYRVTIDLSSREILSIVRNYDEKTQKLPRARKVFVKYTFVPGFGFYDIGLLHILGNTTNALTAGTRELLDMGMFANFPGFLIADSGMRQNTNIFRVPPGGGAQVKTGGMPINQAIMPLPYSAQGMPALQNLLDSIRQTGMRVGGTSEQQVGEGRADAPVGTTLAMMDQAAKIMNSVHKRLCSSQAEEFKLLVICFEEHPESFIEQDCPSQTKWTADTFLKAISDCNLVPQADPNTASHTQRVMKVQGLVMLALQAPELYDPIEVNKVALQTLGWSNPEQYMVPPAAVNTQSPDAVNDGKKADATMMDAQTRANELKAKVQGLGAFAPKGHEPPPPPDPMAQQDMALKAQDLQLKGQDMGLKAQTLQADEREDAFEAENRERDRESQERIALVDFAKEAMKNPPSAVDKAKKMIGPETLEALRSDGPPLPQE